MKFNPRYDDDLHHWTRLRHGIESLCFGARSVVELFEQGGLEIIRMIVTSGLAQNNPLLVQIMDDVLGRVVEVPDIANATAVGAAIHGAAATELVTNYRKERYALGRAVSRPTLPT